RRSLWELRAQHRRSQPWYAGHTTEPGLLTSITFATAVRTVGEEFVDGVLATPYDESIAADRAILSLIAPARPHLELLAHRALDPPSSSSLTEEERLFSLLLRAAARDSRRSQLPNVGPELAR